MWGEGWKREDLGGGVHWGEVTHKDEQYTLYVGGGGRKVEGGRERRGWGNGRTCSTVC